MTASHVYRPCRLVTALTLQGILCSIGVLSLYAQNSRSAVSSGSTSTAKIPSSSTTLPPNSMFDVASIHADNADNTARTHIYSYANQGHFVAVNATLKQLLQYAYALPDSRILQAPAWTKSAKYDIEAKSDPALAERLAALPYPAARHELLKMVQAMLVDRFHLAAHLDSRELPIYNLVVAKGGVKFASVKDESKMIDTRSSSGTSTITIRSSPHAMADLAEILYRYTGRVVIDDTGLQGNYTISLKFSLADQSAAPNTQAAALSDSVPSVFAALKEQLGLELKPSKGPIQVLVIDHVAPPTPN